METVQNECGSVDGILSQFSCFVVPGEDMVVVVPAFAHGHHRHHQVLSRTDTSTIESDEYEEEY